MAAWSGVGPGLVGDVAAEFELKGGVGQVEVAAQAACSSSMKAGAWPWSK